MYSYTIFFVIIFCPFWGGRLFFGVFIFVLFLVGFFFLLFFFSGGRVVFNIWHSVISTRRLLKHLLPPNACGSARGHGDKAKGQLGRVAFRGRGSLAPCPPAALLPRDGVSPLETGAEQLKPSHREKVFWLGFCCCLGLLFCWGEFGGVVFLNYFYLFIYLFIYCDFFREVAADQRHLRVQSWHASIYY